LATVGEKTVDIVFEVVTDRDDHIGALGSDQFVPPSEAIFRAVPVESAVELSFVDVDAMNIEDHSSALISEERAGGGESGSVALGMNDPDGRDTADDPHHECRPPAVESVRKGEPHRQHRHQKRDRPHRANPLDGLLRRRPFR
jgi:hypothetical protein